MARDAPLADGDAVWQDRTCDYRAAVDRAFAMQDVPQVRFFGLQCLRRVQGDRQLSTSSVSLSLLTPKTNAPRHKQTHNRSPCAP